MFIKQQSHKNEFKIGKNQEEEAIEVSKEHEINTDHLTYKDQARSNTMVHKHDRTCQC